MSDQGNRTVCFRFVCLLFGFILVLLFEITHKKKTGDENGCGKKLSPDPIDLFELYPSSLRTELQLRKEGQSIN